MRFIATLLMLSSLLFAYQKGDSLDSQIVQKLNLQSNKVYVIDFFASWCGSCKKELPLISQLNNRLDSDFVEVVGIDADESLSKGKVFQREMNLQFRVVDDPTGAIIKLFDPIGMPAVYIIKDERVADVIFGAKNHIDKQIESIINSLE